MTTPEIQPMGDLSYIDSDGRTLTIEGCRLHIDKAGRYWIWSDIVGHNLVYKSKGLDNSLVAAIGSLLHIITLRDERISRLQQIANLALGFADAIKPDEVSDDYH